MIPPKEPVAPLEPAVTDKGERKRNGNVQRERTLDLVGNFKGGKKTWHQEGAELDRKGF